jgi:hypothetical protein
MLSLEADHVIVAAVPDTNPAEIVGADGAMLSSVVALNDVV